MPQKPLKSVKKKGAGAAKKPSAAAARKAHTQSKKTARGGPRDKVQKKFGANPAGKHHASVSRQVTKTINKRNEESALNRAAAEGGLTLLKPSGK